MPGFVIIGYFGEILKLFFGWTIFTAPLLRLDDGLVAGPKEVVFPDHFHQPAALQHVVCVVVDSREHERAALFA